MKPWSELDKETLGWMDELGNFSPTVKIEDKQLKGHTDEGKTYYCSSDLRQLAKACLDAANWLDERATSLKEKQQ
jgi:hypothetical protein